MRQTSNVAREENGPLTEQERLTSKPHVDERRFVGQLLDKTKRTG